LKAIVDTGAITYGDDNNKDVKRAVQVAKALVKNCQNTYCCIFVDCFYTFLDFLKAMDKMNLYVTGTVMKNCLPKEVIIPKSTKEFKAIMESLCI
jgi:hypothetical protein